MERICHHQSFEVAFSDTDASGRVHFSKMLTYVERAEHEFLNSLGIVVFDEEKQGWPRVRVSCDYSAGLRFGDRAIVNLALSKVGGSSLRWSFEIVDESDSRVAAGEMVTVKVDGDGAATRLTEDEREALEGLL